ncbi:putative quinone oxidoreductase [Lasiosphaeris hirsuta]|uniref:Quinone oxidoreductase n=1 Tax=Lasiosphaeris hirsuta TaxID=260670 RepID=A0AA40AI61_9PEZI|nr:putative quinone oxidoreductase [Lasiosphaeris hirsuta]
MAPINQAAWLHKAGTELQVGDAPLPTAGPDEIVIRNAAIAINPVDCHMQKAGVFVQQWPAIFGCDVAGIVYEVGSNITRFNVGDHVIGHTINLISGRPKDGAFALFTTVPANKAAILPATISFTDGVVVPFALEAAICALSVTEPGTALPGVSTPALGLPYPSLEPVPSGKVIVVNGASSSVGSMVTQLATAGGIMVIGVTSARNAELARTCGAAEVFDYRDSSFVEKVVKAVVNSKLEFVGVVDSVSTGETYPNDLLILKKLSGGHLSCTHPPPTEVPENVKAGMIFAVNDVATPVWEDYVTKALQAGKLKCLPPPTVIGRGLEYIHGALEKCEAGVSAAKLVVEV